MSNPYEGDSSTATTPGLTGKNSAAGSGDGVFGDGFNGVHGEANSAGSGVWGHNSGVGAGVSGQNSGVGTGVVGQGFRGVRGEGSSGTNAIFGVGAGVYGLGFNGVQGESSSGNGSGVWGENTGPGNGVGGKSASGQGVHGESASGQGVHGETASGQGVHGESTSGTGVFGQGGFNGVHGVTANSSASGVWGENTGSGYGVGGKSASGQGVHGESPSGNGVFGQGGFNGVHGVTANSSASGVWGENTGSGYGVGGQSGHAMKVTEPLKAFGAVIGKALRPLQDGATVQQMPRLFGLAATTKTVEEPIA